MKYYIFKIDLIKVGSSFSISSERENGAGSHSLKKPYTNSTRLDSTQLDSYIKYYR